MSARAAIAPERRWGAFPFVLGAAWSSLLSAAAAQAPTPATAPTIQRDAASAPKPVFDGGALTAVASTVDGGAEALAPPLHPSHEGARSQLARERHAEGLRAFKRKDYPRALAGLQDAYAFDPRNAEIVNDLAFVYQVLGNVTEAERYYRETLALEPARGVAHMNLADLLRQKGAPPERLAEAAVHLARARERLGNRASLIARQARVAASRALVEEAARFYREAADVRPPTDALKLEIGDFFRGAGREEEALVWYRRVLVDGPSGRDAAQRIWQIGVEREARRYGFTRPPGEILEAARALLAKARRASSVGRSAEAERHLRRALQMAPAFSAARLELGDVLRAAGRQEEAELSYLRALALDQGSPELYARLGRLYLAAPKGERVAEAAIFLQRALELRPDWTELLLGLARAYRGTGDFLRAYALVERFLSTSAAPEAHAEARALRAALEPLVRAKAKPPGERPTASASDPAVARARVLLARGQSDAALAELARLSKSARTAEVLALEASILFAAGKREAALEALRASLGKDEAQAGVHAQLGVLLSQVGRLQEARRHLHRAEELGDGGATFQLARLDAATVGGVRGALGDMLSLARLYRLRTILREALAGGRVDAYAEDARRLLASLGDRLLVAVGAWLGGLLALGVGLVLWRRRRAGGIDLSALIEAHPESGPDVQRILSAIRHEVLKHNTMVLTGLVESLERGEHAAAAGLHCVRSFFGEGGGAGAAARLALYADELRQVGRAHGERLNLERRDPALGALLAGFRVVRRLAGRLARVDTLGPRARARLARQLRHGAHLLNVEGYEAVRALLDRLRVLELDRALLEGLFARTLREPALAAEAARIEPLDLDDDALPVHVLVPRRAFEDIAQNLLRNALQSSLRHLRGGVRVGLRVGVELDPITGLERVALFILDASPAQLTAEMLRGRYIEEGLGLTADLVSRYEGTLDVSPASPPWRKAVVVKLPRAEAPEPEEGT